MDSLAANPGSSGPDKENTPPEGERPPTPTQDEGSSLGSLPCSVGSLVIYFNKFWQLIFNQK